LNSLAQNFGSINTSSNDIFILQQDSVYIEVIAKSGAYSALLAMIQTSPYGMTDLIDNGTNTLIISGKYPVANLLKLDSLPIAQYIDYARPLFPAIPNSGVAYTNGDVAQHSDFARNGFNVHGENVKVGVISDSYNTVLGNPAQTDV